jgi:hypothetical protein
MLFVSEFVFEFEFEFEGETRVRSAARPNRNYVGGLVDIGRCRNSTSTHFQWLVRCASGYMGAGAR